MIVSKTISSYNARSANIAQFSKEYNNIIIVINGINLYIISQEGNLLANKESVTFLDITKFYSIIPYEKEDNEYIFYLLFYDSSSDKKLRYSKGTYESSNIVLTDPDGLILPTMESTYFNIDCVLLENGNVKL